MLAFNSLASNDNTSPPMIARSLLIPALTARNSLFQNRRTVTAHRPGLEGVQVNSQTSELNRSDAESKRREDSRRQIDCREAASRVERARRQKAISWQLAA